MSPPRRDAAQVIVVEVGRPPGDAGQAAREGDGVLAGAAADFQYVTCAAAEKRFKHRRNSGVVAMKCSSIEPSVFRRRTILAELNNKLSHCFTLSLRRPQPKPPRRPSRRHER